MPADIQGVALLVTAWETMVGPLERLGAAIEKMEAANNANAVAAEVCEMIAAALKNRAELCLLQAGAIRFRVEQRAGGGQSTHA